MRWQARRRLPINPNAREIVEWSFSPNQILSRGVYSESKLLWPFFVKIVECLKGFLLFLNPTVANWIPAHGFASAEAVRDFAALARSCVTKYVVIGECRFPAKPKPVGLDEL